MTLGNAARQTLKLSWIGQGLAMTLGGALLEAGSHHSLTKYYLRAIQEGEGIGYAHSHDNLYIQPHTFFW